MSKQRAKIFNALILLPRRDYICFSSGSTNSSVFWLSLWWKTNLNFSFLSYLFFHRFYFNSNRLWSNIFIRWKIECNKVDVIILVLERFFLFSLWCERKKAGFDGDTIFTESWSYVHVHYSSVINDTQAKLVQREADERGNWKTRFNEYKNNVKRHPSQHSVLMTHQLNYHRGFKFKTLALHSNCISYDKFIHHWNSNSSFFLSYRFFINNSSSFLLEKSLLFIFCFLVKFFSCFSLWENFQINERKTKLKKGKNNDWVCWCLHSAEKN